LLELAEKVDFPLIEVLTDVESNGIAIDSEALIELSALIGEEAEKLTAAIYDEAGTEFNIDSPKQMGHILFEKLMIPPIKKTKTGYSTDVNVLTQLAEIYPIAKYILEYRSLVKIKSTYADALPKLINENTGRIHTTFNQTVALTGRLSSTDPNLQNIPIRTELGQQIRKAFVPSQEDTVIIAADYSQVELRIMAYYSGDERLSQAFIDGEDIHAATAAHLFDVDVSEVTKDQRRKAKTVNFGIMYGLGTFGLAQRLDIPRAEASEIISNYFEKYPKIKQYIDDTINSTHEKGYAETMLGRRRYFPEINSPNRNVKTAAERAAINMPIQGSAADMIKLAMINIWKRMKAESIRSKMLLQVHDELV
ncbi:MAG: DNA polymerase I, partial [Chlorobi bacterium]|nr:DNA polymerase I [Chlorobiota bacterium]